MPRTPLRIIRLGRARSHGHASDGPRQHHSGADAANGLFSTIAETNKRDSLAYERS